MSPTARHFKPAVIRARLPEATRFHDLRHSYAAMLIAEGAHPRAIMERLGHSTIQVTLGTYGHLFPSLEASLTEALDDVYRTADRLTKRPPPVGLATEELLDEMAERCLELTSHLWFLEGAPAIYDRGQELLARAAEERKFGSKMTVRDPIALDVSEIRYHRNPFKRLQRMHVSSTEMVTGFSYKSPWSG